MLQVINDKGELVNVRANDKGELKVAGVVSGNGSVSTGNLPNETTLVCNVQTVGTENISYGFTSIKHITSIDIANYSESATVNLKINNGAKIFVIGSGIATTLPINEDLEGYEINSTEDNTKVQIIVKGVE